MNALHRVVSSSPRRGKQPSTGPLTSALADDFRPVSVRASGRPGIPGWFTAEQIEAWKPIVSAVHEQGGFFFAQLWHQGRNTHSRLTGQLPESSSAIGLRGCLTCPGMPALPFETPKAMTSEDISATQADFVQAALKAVEAGCDGIEIHAGNGYVHRL